MSSTPNFTKECRVLVCLALFACGACGFNARFAWPAQEARQGVFDLRAHPGRNPDPVELRGQWRVHWDRFTNPGQPSRSPDSRKSFGSGAEFLTLPGNWDSFHRGRAARPSRGIATISLIVLLPENSEQMALHMPRIWTAHRLFVNGRRIASMGKVSAEERKAVPALLPYVVRLPRNQRSLHLVLHVSNFHHRKGGIQDPILLGRLKNVRRVRERNLALDLLMAGCALLMGLYHLTLNAFLRRQGYASLYFFFFALVVALRTLLKGEQAAYLFFPRLPYELLLRGDFLLLPTALILLSLYLRSLYPSEISRSVVRTVVAVSILDLVVNLTLPVYVMSFTTTLYVPFILLVGFSYLFMLTRAVRVRRRGAPYVLLGYSIFFAFVINDILYEMNVSPLRDSSTTGLLLFILTQSAYMSICFARTFAAVQKLSRSSRRLLHENNQYSRTLEDRVRERTRQLHESEGRFRGLADSTFEGLLIHRGSRILDANEAVGRMLGLPVGGLRGRDISEFMTEAGGAWPRLHAPDHPGAFETTFSTVEGTSFPAEVLQREIIYDGAPALVTAIRDITERKRLEQLRLNMESIIRHDLKDPVAGIISTADLMLGDHRGPADRRLVMNIHGSALRMMDMIRHSLDGMRGETPGPGAVGPGSVDFMSILERLRERFRYLLKERGLHLRMPDPRAISAAARVQGVEHLLESMASNLLKNALEAAPAGSEVRVELRQNDGILLEIHNQGSVPREARADFLERKTTFGKPMGDGVGAYAARWIARMHGGDIHYSTSEEAGTRIVVELPMVADHWRADS